MNLSKSLIFLQTVAAPHHTSRFSNVISIIATNHYYQLITNRHSHITITFVNYIPT